MKTIEFTNDFNIKPEEKAVLVYSAPWCNKCEMLHKIIEAIDYKGDTKVVFIDVDKFSDLPSVKNILSLPQVSVLRENGETFVSAGRILNQKEILDILKQ